MDVKNVAASAVVLVGVWEVARAFRDTAPSLQDLREHDAKDTAQRQQLLDAIITVGGVTLLASVILGYLSGSYLVPIVMMGVFAWHAGYYHLIQKGLTSDQLDG